MSGPAGNVLPIYFVADESGSMHGDIPELNKGLTSLLASLQEESMAASKVRFSVLGFADDTTCYLDLVDLRGIESMPDLSSRGSTSYASVFGDLLQRIPEDVRRLKAQEYMVNRPAVFFLTDGAPNAGEDWQSLLRQLKSPEFRQRPNILAFGIGSADPSTIVQIASQEQYAFQAAQGTDTGRAVANFCQMLTQSIVSSGQALAEGTAVLQGERPEGFTMAIDVV